MCRSTVMSYNTLGVASQGVNWNKSMIYLFVLNCEYILQVKSLDLIVGMRW